MEIKITDLKFDKFAIILDNVFTKEECNNLIELSEKTPENYELAKINVGYNQQRINTSYRNSQRWLNFNKTLADSFFEKIKDYIPKKFENRNVSCLNERLSFLKYFPGEYFKSHMDGRYTRPDNSESSYITVQIYLNDLNVEDGGETTIFKDSFNGIHQEYRVIPKIGRVLLFEHEIEHEGSILQNGIKYCIRTDVMYKNEESSLYSRFFVSDEDLQSSESELLDKNELAKKLYNKAVYLEMEKNYEESIEMYKKAFKLDPNVEKNLFN